jgi:hypothetical protein
MNLLLPTTLVSRLSDDMQKALQLRAFTLRSTSVSDPASLWSVEFSKRAQAGHVSCSRWPSHNFRNTGCPLLPRCLPAGRGPLHGAGPLAGARHARITKSCVKSPIGSARSARSSPPKKASLAGAAPARPLLRAPCIAFVPHAMPPTGSAPPSGPARVSGSHGGLALQVFGRSHLSPSQPSHQHRRDRGAHREPVSASSSRIFLRCRRAVPASSGTFSTPDPYST